MDLLLDTHVFLWWDDGGERLSADVRAVISDPASKVFVSAASVWEIAIKRQSGKLRFDGSAVAAIAANHFSELAIEASHAERAGGLAWDHRDAFDRMLVAQSLQHSLTLVTCDPAIRGFDGIAVLWAAG
jgi:PIN domain nuclease of toxin-antitoxin system